MRRKDQVFIELAKARYSLTAAQDARGTIRRRIEIVPFHGTHPRSVLFQNLVIGSGRSEAVAEASSTVS